MTTHPRARGAVCAVAGAPQAARTSRACRAWPAGLRRPAPPPGAAGLSHQWRCGTCGGTGWQARRCGYKHESSVAGACQPHQAGCSKRQGASLLAFATGPHTATPATHAQSKSHGVARRLKACRGQKAKGCAPTPGCSLFGSEARASKTTAAGCPRAARQSNGARGRGAPAAM